MRATTNRLERGLRAEGDLKLVVYVMAGHPTKKKSLDIAKRIAASGVAAIELGVPHSDPLADGPVIQKAGQVALEHGMTMGACLELAGEVAAEGVPIVLMSCVNPILAHDARRFAADAAQAGVAGVIVPDMPIEEAEPVASWMRAAALDTVFMVAPTTAPNRIGAICERSSGFVYCVTVTGITGARKDLPVGLKDLVGSVRERTELPVAAGFGISRAEHMKALRGVADAAVVGSAVVAEIDAGKDPVPLIKELLKACR